MPTYDYLCDRCGKFEYFQSMKESPLEKCPTCGGAVRRAISAGAGLIFKGSGFYITDYRNAEYKEKAKQDTGSGSSAAPAKTEDKPASSSGNGSGQNATGAGSDSKASGDPK